MPSRHDTIAAVATAPGRGGVAVVRVSGPEAFAVANELTGRACEPGRIRHAVLRRGAVRLDEAVVLAFAAPHSYTGEDVVEFQCHGGTVTPRRVLEACFASGARLARRGEFTERAFLNGKLDLGQAESVLNLIDAKTERAADAALEGLAGHGTRCDREMYERALAISAELEHALDVDEGELPDGFEGRQREAVRQLAERIDTALRRVRAGRILRDGALVVLAGPPNVGKSSLMNALLRENRAIVSDRPGTTRDSIEEWLDVDGWPVRLVDTAGLRATSDAIEAEGVRRSEALIAKADIVLELKESSAAPQGPVDSVIPQAPKILRVWTKCDLVPHGRSGADGIGISAKTGVGLDDLRKALAARLSRLAEPEEAVGAADTAAGTYGEEEISALAAVRSVLRSVLEETSDDLVLLANGVRAAADRLGELVGATYATDLLERLFARFCVGK